jgi:hypothetical protein
MATTSTPQARMVWITVVVWSLGVVIFEAGRIWTVDPGRERGARARRRVSGGR